jgi:hypothetical protein
MASLFPGERILSAHVPNGPDCRVTELLLYQNEEEFFKLVWGGVDNPPTLPEIGFWVPERHRPSRPRPLFIPVGARTCALSDALTRAISL